MGGVDFDLLFWDIEYSYLFWEFRNPSWCTDWSSNPMVAHNPLAGIFAHKACSQHSSPLSTHSTNVQTQETFLMVPWLL